MSKMVTRQLGQDKQESFRDVPEDIEDLGFWQKLSFVRFRGWNKGALRDRQEKRSRVPREIFARKRVIASHDDSAVSKTIDVSGVVAGVEGTAACDKANLESSSMSTEAKLKELSLKEKEVDKELDITGAFESYRVRRWILPVAVGAVIFCRILLYQRRR